MVALARQRAVMLVVVVVGILLSSAFMTRAEEALELAARERAVRKLEARKAAGKRPTDGPRSLYWMSETNMRNILSRRDEPYNSCPDVPFEQMDSSYNMMCSEDTINILSTLDSNYLRGLFALVNSLLRNASCPHMIFFHFATTASDNARASSMIRYHFPHLKFRTYEIDGLGLHDKIRRMEHRGDDLENPLNYARIVMPAALPVCIGKIIYLATDVISIGRIENLWVTQPQQQHVIASPEFCEWKAKDYFTEAFWELDQGRTRADLKTACYFNPGVMVINITEWKSQGITEQLLSLLLLQKQAPRALWSLGSLPPFLAVFAGRLLSIDRHWNAHDLGCSCSVAPHPRLVQIAHWSCDGKPWRRLGGPNVCATDLVYWSPFDLGEDAIRRAEKRIDEDTVLM